MSIVAPPEPRAQIHGHPEDYRMTIGEHLEELRKRLILGIVGLVIAMGFCLYFGGDVVLIFCKPLTDVLEQNRINPQLVVDEVSEGFMVFMRISTISALALASPWMLSQLWLFVAAGLYPNERKYVTRYLPLSVALLCAGMLFVYFFVLPWTLSFFVEFNSAFSIKPYIAPHASTALPATMQSSPLNIPMLAGDPTAPIDGDLWFDTDRGVLKFYRGETRVISINSANLLAQEYKLSDYLSFVVMMLITFGLSFQLPLAVLALERTGIVEIESFRRARRGVYFAIVVAAAIITPGDYAITTLALMVPLIGLYELGILLAATGKGPALQNDAA